ncbi:MAG: response regulator [Prevotella sp.]|nr:response regulator [Prevotella sp.]
MNSKNLLALVVTFLLLAACTGSRMNQKQLAEKRDSIESLIKEGKELREASDFIHALDIHQKALHEALRINDAQSIVVANNNVATDLRRMGMLNEALSYHYTALDYCEKMEGDTSYQARKNLVISLNGIGNIQMSLGDYVNAENVFHRALQGEQLLKSDLGMAINYANIGSIKEQKGDIDSALWYYRKSMEHNIKAESDLGISLCHNHFGRIAENKGNYDEALKEYQEAYGIMQDSDDKWHWLESVLALARVNLKTGNLDDAKTHIVEAHATAKTIHSREHIAAIYHILSDYEEQTGHPDMALYYYKQADNITDSIVNEKNIDKLQTLRLNYERQKSRKDYNSLKQSFDKEQKEKRSIILIGLIIFALTAAALGFMIYAHQIRLRSNRSLKQMEKLRNTFFTNITHEFRTPITIIMGLAHQLKEKKVSQQDMPETLATIEKQSGSLLTLVNQLLDISRIMSNNSDDEKWVTGNIVLYTKMTVEGYRQYAATKGITITFKSTVDDMQVDFVEEYAEKTLRNLIGNALKYTPPGGTITVSTSTDGTNMILEVSDNGCGFPEEDLPYVFTMFFQGSNNRENTNGTGIGLNYVSQIVSRMRGTIKASNNKSGGATVTLTGPMKYEGMETTPWNPALSSMKPVDFKDSAPAEKAGNNEDPLEDKETILLVEDNADISKYMHSLIKDNYNVTTAKDGVEALAKAEDIVPDLIITDIMMPNMYGYELCRRIRQTEDLNHIPIIIISARTQEEDRLKGIDAGADAYLTKPFIAEELYSLIHRMLEGRRLLREKFSRVLLHGKDELTGDEQNEGRLMDMNEDDAEFLDLLTRRIQTTIGDKDFSSSTLASGLCLSYSQLNRKVKNITGISIGAFVTRVRLEKAQRQIMQTNMPISDIALNCGFDDNSYFSRAFKQAYGESPTQYRSKRKHGRS